VNFIEQEFGSKEFVKVDNPLKESDRKYAEKYQLYDIKYYQDELNIIE
jgi:hypothetical protein